MVDEAVEAELRAAERAAVPATWTWWQRLLFRVAFLFWGDYCLQHGVLWQVTWFAPWINRWVLRWPFWVLGWPTKTLESWLESSVFHLSGEAAKRQMTGSGDTSLAWIAALALVVFAILGALLWTAVAEWGIRKRGWHREYRSLYAWLRLAVRFTLASTLLSYGFSKIFDLQFSPPGAWRLSETYGDSSPMGLLWTFMGYSVPYTMFAGIAEVVPGLLLMFRRTMTVGALSASAVLFNVVVLNFCYDVPVKLFSTELLLMALFLLLPDIAPMWRFLLMKRAAKITGAWLPHWERRPLRIGGYCLQAVVVAHLVYLYSSSSYQSWRKGRVEESAPQASLYGWYAVDSSHDGSEAQEWKTLGVGMTYDRDTKTDYMNIVFENGEQQNVPAKEDVKARSFSFPTRKDSVFMWTRDASGEVSIRGKWKGDDFAATMHPLEDRSVLMTRRCHWVQEKPFNR